jgi:diguanylate cyclase (GGDEF)-like protein
LGKVLVVEDSNFFSSLLKKKIESRLGLEVFIAETFAKAREIVESNEHEFFISILDLNLPDTESDEIVNYILCRGMSAAVFTSNMTSKMRQNILGKNIIDYILKDSPSSLDYVVSLVERLQKNSKLTAMIVEDSSATRNHIASLLRLYRFKVIEAENGAEALKIIETTPDLALIITDYDMPKMNGVEMIKNIRTKMQKAELPIIGLSASGNSGEMSARFIKLGANDFLHKPFLQEEFFYRINQTLEFAEHVCALNDMATKDYLTGLYNRRHVINAGKQLIASRNRNHSSFIVAMMDIDYFKKVNDTYGHEAGDLVLKAVSDTLASEFRQTDIVGRMGGEEFCVIAVSLAPEKRMEVFDRVRRAIEDLRVNIGDQEIRVTISIGVCTEPLPTLEDMINSADALLYAAKEGGRNRIVMQDASVTPAGLLLGAANTSSPNNAANCSV